MVLWYRLLLVMTIGGGGKMGPSIGRPRGGVNKKKKMRKRGDGLE